MDSANAFDDDSHEGAAALRDEIAAVEAELKATQARLDALWAKAESIEGASRSGFSQQATQQESHEQVQAQGQQSQATQPQSRAQEASQQQQQQATQQQQGSQQSQSYRQPSYAYQQQAYTYQPPSQPPFAQQPAPSSIAYSKDHVAAGLLAIFLGSLGIHKFYLGYNTAGFIMLALTILGSLFTFGVAAVAMVVISIIEGIIYLTKSQTEFEHIYVLSKKEWF